MKKTLILALITFICTYNLHAAARPEAETVDGKLSSQEVLNLHDKALAAFRADQPGRFMQIITAHPEVIDITVKNRHKNLLYEIIFAGELTEMGEISGKPIDYSFYISQVLATDNKLRFLNLSETCRSVFFHICQSDPNKYFAARLLVLTKLFYLFKSSGAVLSDELKTDKIRTP